MADDTARPVAGIIDFAQLEASQLSAPLVIGAPSPNVGAVIGVDDAEADWVIPALLRRGDRLLITAGEGDGKSVLCAQIAVCAAAGLHPTARRSTTRSTCCTSI